MKNLLLTQCLQNDFVQSYKAEQSLPNPLHIGYDESHRLMGLEPEHGPVSKFMEWTKTQGQQLAVFHIRDWHDTEDPHQQSHLKQFGQHCIKDSYGAEFVFPVDEQKDTIFNSTTLNDFVDSGLSDALEQALPELERVGIIGVWTEAKVMFLAYELTTRYPQLEVAICSALTASSSRSQHFLALQQLERIVGVKVIDSIGEFQQFLGGEGRHIETLSINESLQINYRDDVELIEHDKKLLNYLFRDCRSVDLKVLDGGFSGNLVAGASSIDIYGQEQTPHVVKIGERQLMAQERTSFEQIETVLGNNVPAIAEYADFDTRGAIKYRYASMGEGAVLSFQDVFQQGADVSRIKHYLDVTYNQQLGKLYRASVNEKQCLLEYYCFDSSWADSVEKKVVALVNSYQDSPELELYAGRTTYNPAWFYRYDIEQLRPLNIRAPFAFIHGDLNGANILVDNNDNLWLIDFFHTHKGHVFKDFAKLENDILYIYTPVESEEELVTAFDFTDFLLDSEDPFSPLSLPEQFLFTPFERSYQVLCYLRQQAAQYLDGETEQKQLQWLIPQLRYSVHTIGFDEPNEYQRIWALYTSGKLIEKLKQCCLS
ncbi:isochorismatase family protein [Pleionea sp. CnH1-48]|uniref:isochorismatase family protein n=1 Tax=Pleionea sp. CnH1-48 TaxID=2954494 RepID=UPI0020977E51|nr:isochorismatase family protein [Pleionea sp. CnH1-48]MCO7226740.1 isochorismatase family protein [Pleionea sp. CnH1-48]